MLFELQRLPHSFAIAQNGQFLSPDVAHFRNFHKTSLTFRKQLVVHSSLYYNRNISLRNEASWVFWQKYLFLLQIHNISDSGRKITDFHFGMVGSRSETHNSEFENVFPKQFLTIANNCEKSVLSRPWDYNLENINYKLHWITIWVLLFHNSFFESVSEHEAADVVEAEVGGVVENNGKSYQYP